MRFDLGRRRPPSGMPVDSWLANLFARPSNETVHDVDDEFDDGSLSGWTQVDAAGSASVTWTEEADLLSLLVPTGDGAGDLHAQMEAASLPIGGYIQTCLTVGSHDTGYFHVGLVLADGVVAGSGTQLYFGAEVRNGKFFSCTWSGYDTRTSILSEVDYEQSSIFVGRLYLRVTHLAANSFRLEWSTDGVSWIRATNDTSPTLTPTHVGIAATAWDVDRDSMVSFDYFRYTP